MDSTNLDFGKELRAGRKQVGLSQAELARKLYVKPTYVAKMEAGLIIASESEKQALASILPIFVDLDSLLESDFELSGVFRATWHPYHPEASGVTFYQLHKDVSAEKVREVCKPGFSVRELDEVLKER